MRLSSIHEAGTKSGPKSGATKGDGLPHQDRVWQREEQQGASHKKHWYQKYHRKAKPYRWPRHSNSGRSPKATGYDEHILENVWNNDNAPFEVMIDEIVDRNFDVGLMKYYIYDVRDRVIDDLLAGEALASGDDRWRIRLMRSNLAQLCNLIRTMDDPDDIWRLAMDCKATMNQIRHLSSYARRWSEVGLGMQVYAGAIEAYRALTLLVQAALDHRS